MIKKLRHYFTQQDDVLFAYLFGSYARGEATRLSDLDVALFCGKKCDRLKIMSELSELVGIEKVDVVDLSRLKNNSILLDIIREGIVLKDHSKREQWEVRTYHRLLDFFASTRRIYGY